jgi:hypothetical protein
VGGLDSLQFGDDSLSVLHADGGGVDLLSCSIVSCHSELIWPVGKCIPCDSRRAFKWPATQPSPPQMRKTGLEAIVVDFWY